MSQSLRAKLGAFVLLAAAVIGLITALYAYFTPLTGVTGSLGALVAIAACIVLIILAIMLAALQGRGARIALRVLILIGLAGTCFAGLLLHQWWLCVAMVLGLIGLIIDLCRPAHNTRPTHL